MFGNLCTCSDFLNYIKLNVKFIIKPSRIDPCKFRDLFPQPDRALCNAFCSMISKNRSNAASRFWLMLFKDPSLSNNEKDEECVGKS